MNNPSEKITATRTWNRGIFRTVCNILHLIAIIQFSYAVYYDLVNVQIPLKFSSRTTNFGGKFKYLTFLNCIIQALFYAICLVNDLIGSNEAAPKKVPAIRKLKDYVFATFAFPLAMTVGTTFWLLMAIDRELVFPKEFDEFFPTWLNHVMHTNIVIFIVLEMVISVRQYPTRKNGLTGLTVFMVAYLVWVHIIKYVAGIWVYPVLNVLNFYQRLVFYVAVLTFCASMYFIGEFVNHKFGKPATQTVKTSIKSKRK